MKIFPACLTLLLATSPLCAQSAATPPPARGFLVHWLERTSATQNKQPGWAVPLITTTTGLIQVFRTDFIRQIAPAGTQTWILDNSKGLNIIPWANTEIDIDLPPWLRHNSTAKDGFGDMSFQGKYRIATGDAQHGNYNVTFFLGATVPTGGQQNGAVDAAVQPNLGLGKGFGRWDVQSTLGATLPLGKSATTTVGRPILWNTVLQYRAARILWPEVESNATFFKGGTKDGETMDFVTPAVIVGKCALHPSIPGSRPGLGFGAGMQIATTHFHTYNHALILTARWIF
jgi:hypothetical protein